MKRIVIIGVLSFLVCESLPAQEMTGTPTIQEDTHVQKQGDRQKSPVNTGNKTLKDDNKAFPEGQKDIGERKKSTGKAEDKDKEANMKDTEKQNGNGERQRNTK